MESLKGSRDKELLHCSQCQAMTVGCILSFSNKRAAISVNLCRTGNTHNGIVPFIVISAGKRKPWLLNSYGFIAGRVFEHARQWLLRRLHPVNKHLQQRRVNPAWVKPQHTHTRQSKKGPRSQKLAWLIEGCPVVFLLEVVSRPQREENRLRRLLKVRGMAWFRFLMLLSVRADTWVGEKDLRSAIYRSISAFAFQWLLRNVNTIKTYHSSSTFNPRPLSVTHITSKQRNFWHFWVNSL